MICIGERYNAILSLNVDSENDVIKHKNTAMLMIYHKLASSNRLNLSLYKRKIHAGIILINTLIKTPLES